MQQKGGQAIVWLVMLAVVGLTLGLSIAARSLSNVKQSSELEASSRAFSAAEAGVEEALYALESTGTAAPALTPSTLAEGGSSYYYDVSTGGGGSELVLASPLEKDRVIQVDCSGMSGNITVYWVEDATSQEQNGNRASLLLTFISQEAVDNYAITRQAYNPAEEAAARDNGFSLATGGAFTVAGKVFAEKTAGIALPGSGANKILRINAFYNSIANTIALTSSAGNFPAQYHIVTSTGAANDTERTIKVTRSKPALPDLFDFALLNLSANKITK